MYICRRCKLQIRIPKRPNILEKIYMLAGILLLKHFKNEAQRLKFRSSTAGLSHVLSSLLQVMPRLRVGIGRPTGKTTVERHVLGRFSSEEKKVLDSVLVQSVDLLLSQLSQQDSQQEPQSPSSPAGGRHAAQNRKERERSASPAEDSAAAQS